MSDDQTQQQDFAAVLLSHDKGRVHAEASTKLTDAVEAVMETGKAATITLKIKVSPVKDLTAIKLDASCTASIPREPSKSIWYVDDASVLHRNDPRQQSLFGDGAEEVHRSESAPTSGVVRHES